MIKAAWDNKHTLFIVRTRERSHYHWLANEDITEETRRDLEKMNNQNSEHCDVSERVLELVGELFHGELECKLNGRRISDVYVFELEI